MTLALELLWLCAPMAAALALLATPLTVGPIDRIVRALLFYGFCLILQWRLSAVGGVENWTSGGDPAWMGWFFSAVQWAQSVYGAPLILAGARNTAPDPQLLNYLANAGLVVVYAGLHLLWGAAVWSVRAFRGPADPRWRRLRWLQGGVQRAVAVWAAICTVGFFAFLPFVYEFAPAGYGQRLGAGLSYVLWAAPLVLIVEIALASRGGDRAARGATPARAESPSYKPHEPFFRKLEAIARESAGADAFEIADKSRATGRPQGREALRQAIDAAKHRGDLADPGWRSLAQALLIDLQDSGDPARARYRNPEDLLDTIRKAQRLWARDQRAAMLFTEPVSEAHLVTIAALIHRVNDAGGAAVVLTPDGWVEPVAERLRQDGLMTGMAHDQRWASLRSSVAPSDGEVLDAMIGGLDDLEERVLLDRSGAFEATRRRIRLVAVLGLDALDLGKLRRRLRRLEAIDPSGRPHRRFIVQSMPLFGIESATANLFGVAADALHAFSLGEDVVPTRRIVAFPESADALSRAALTLGGAKESVRRDLPTAMIWRIEGVLDGLRPATLLNPFGAAPAAYYNAPLERLRPEAPDAWRDPTIADALHAESAPTPSSAAQNQVQIFDRVDRGVAWIAKGAVNGPRSDEALTILRISAHPTGDLTLAALKVAAGTGDDATLELWRPIAARPEGGLVELGAELAGALHAASRRARDAGAGVTLADLEALFSDANRADLLRRLGAAPTRSGAERALQLALGENYALRADVNGSHEVVFTLAAGGQRDDQVLGRTPVHGPGDQALLGYARRSDHGLRYALGSWLEIDGALMRIRSFRPDRIDVEAAPHGAPDASLRHLFARRYALSDPASTILIARTPFEADAPADRALLQVRAARRTPAFRYRRVRPTGEVDWPLVDVEGGAPSAARHRFAIALRFRRGDPAVEAALKSGERAALTLAVTLEDTLDALFPNHVGRIAVCPDMTPPRADGGEADKALSTRVATIDAPAERAVAQGVEEVADLGSPLHAVFDAAFGESRAARAPNAVVDGHAALGRVERPFGVLVFEDGLYDLGVARAAHEHWDRVAAAWLDYLDWLAEAEGAPKFFYRYETPDAPSMLDIAAARALVATLTLTGSRTRREAGRPRSGRRRATGPDAARNAGPTG